MTPTNKIRSSVEAIPDPAIREVSLRLLERLIECARDRSAMWTYAGLASLADTSADNQTLHRAIEVLSSRPSAKILEMHFLYFDPEKEEPAGEHISDEEISKAFQSGYLTDPQSGREIHDFMRYLSPYFQISIGAD